MDDFLDGDDSQGVAELVGALLEHNAELFDGFNGVQSGFGYN